MRRRSILRPLVLVAALTLAGCGDDPAEFGDPAGDAPPSTEAGPAEGEQDEEEPTSEPTTEEGADPGAEADASGPAASEQVDPADVIAETTYPMTASDVDEGTITVGVHELRVDGETMLLTLYFTPEFDGDDRLNLFQMHGYSQLSPVLNDRANLKQYTVLEGDAPGAWSTKVGPEGVSAGSGETLVWWGNYSAPEDEIDTVAVSVFSGAAELDVRIDR